MSSPLAVNAGELRHTIQIQSPSTTQDSFGQPTDAWNTALTVHAKIETLSLNEAWATSEYVGKATHRVTMRYTSEPITAGMRVVFGARTYRIQAVENVLERNRVLKILCLELIKS